MNRKVVLLNVLLLGLVIWLGAQIREAWLNSVAREQAALARVPKPAPAIPPPAVAPVGEVTAAEYLPVAQQNLFSKDRNPNVIIDVTPPPPPPPEPPVPALPKYYGQMAIGTPVIILATDKTPAKSYHVGDKVGEFTVDEFDRDSVTLKWRDKTLTSSVKELTPKPEDRKVTAASAVAARPAPKANVGNIGDNTSQEKVDPELGAPNGIYRNCLVNDTSPAGTRRSGYVKVMTITLMGPDCHWEPVR